MDFTLDKLETDLISETNHLLSLYHEISNNDIDINERVPILDEETARVLLKIDALQTAMTIKNILEHLRGYGIEEIYLCDMLHQINMILDELIPTDNKNGEEE